MYYYFLLYTGRTNLPELLYLRDHPERYVPRNFWVLHRANASGSIRLLRSRDGAKQSSATSTETTYLKNRLAIPHGTTDFDVGNRHHSWAYCPASDDMNFHATGKMCSAVTSGMIFFEDVTDKAWPVSCFDPDKDLVRGIEWSDGRLKNPHSQWSEVYKETFSMNSHRVH